MRSLCVLSVPYSVVTGCRPPNHQRKRPDYSILPNVYTLNVRSRLSGKLKIDNEILCLFYNSTVLSILVYDVPCWFNLCDKKQKKEVCKFAKRMKKMTGDCNQVENPTMISTKKCKSLISKMV